MAVEGLSREEKERILKALEVDREFRYAMMGLLGFREVLERITRLEECFAELEKRYQQLEERRQRLEERFQKLEERFARLEERYQRLEEEFLELRKAQQRLEKGLQSPGSSVACRVPSRLGQRLLQQPVLPVSQTSIPPRREIIEG